MGFLQANAGGGETNSKRPWAPQEMIILAAKKEDLGEINAIYNYYVEHSTCVWGTRVCSEALREGWFEEHREKEWPILVARQGGKVVGWGTLGSFREAYTDNGTLEDSVYVHHEYLRRGIGGRLLAALIEAARQKGLRSILANISGDQEASIRLHEKFGFQKVAHLREVGAKFGRVLDAVYMQLMLSKTPFPASL